ncbi:MAG: DUF6268 family outer membrane beta-barrel protein [Candidatus Omnitrophica bacterium]|nr:DUF6268 family outer membrane beta-barrel protein [Candidatus Omnitrophota bacterium]
MKNIICCLLAITLSLFLNTAWAKQNYEAERDRLIAMALIDAQRKLEKEPISEEKAIKEKGMGEFSFDSSARYMPAGDVENKIGQIEIIDQSSKAAYEFKAFGKLPLEFSLGERYIGIDNTTMLELPSHLTAVSLGLEATLPFFNFENMYLRLGTQPSFYTDNWDFKTSSFRIPNYTYVIYRPNDVWTFIAGVAVTPDFETEVWPLLGFIYKPNDKLIFNLLPQRPNVTYRLNEKVSLFAEGGFSFLEFEVDKGGMQNVILKYREIHLGAGARLKINPFIQLSISAGGMFGRRLEYRDNLGKAEIKSGLYSELRLEISR